MKLFLTASLITLTTSAMAQDIWTITTSEGLEFTHEMDRAKNRYAMVDMWEFSGQDFLVRIAPDFDDGMTETTDFGANNTIVTLPLEINGQVTQVGCDPADEPVGTATITELTDETISGAFEIEIVSCEDYMTAEPVVYEGLPFTISGVFSVALK